jgi:long-chain fatty acid transport protein
MSRTVRQVALATCLGAIASCVATEAAHASAFALHEFTAEGLGNAFAGQTAKAYDASTVYYNPAGMAFLDGNELFSTVTWIQPDVHFTGSNSNPLYAAGVGGPTVSGINGPNVVKPAALGAGFGNYKINDDFSVGFSITVPYGQRSEYKENWVGRYQALASDITDYEFALMLSYKINDKWSVGGGPKVDYFEGRLSQALNVSAIGLNVAQGLGNGATQAATGAAQAAAGAQQAAAAAAAAAAAGNSALAATYTAQANQLAAQANSAKALATSLGAQATTMQTMALGWFMAGSDGLGKLTGDDWEVGYKLATLYQIDPGTRLGLTYTSKVFHDLNGSSQIQLPGNAAAAPSAFTSLFTNQQASLKLTMPDNVAVGFYHEINKAWAIMADAQWTDWSVLKELNVVGKQTGLISSTPENWTNTWAVSVGANWKPIDKWTLHVGTAYDQAPMNDGNRLSRVPDMNRYWASFGASYEINKSSKVHLGYAHLFTTGGNITDGSNAANGGGVLTGSYTGSVDIVSASYEMKF